MSLHAPVVIVGSGQAGGRAAEALRQGGHVGRITLIGDEPHAPLELLERYTRLDTGALDAATDSDTVIAVKSS